jgi:predicted phage terminase large subunit-like protein
MVFAPPQHGKSELVSVRFPAFWFAKRPEDPIILCSYGASLAYDKAYQTRQLILGQAYNTLFPDIRISTTTRGGDNWRIAKHRGAFYAAGVGGPITGRGGMLGIIDDPFKNYQDAESLHNRHRVYQWYQTTFRTRIWEDGAIILVMTRWHEDDLAGRLMNDQKENWEILRLPAIAETQKERDENNRYMGLTELIGKPDETNREPGEPLCPQRYSLKSLLSLKTDVGPIGWAAQFDGVPRLPEGNIIKRSWFKEIYIEELKIESLIALIRYWDKAATEGGGTRTAGVLIGMDILRRFYVIDVVKGQWSEFNRERQIKLTAERDGEIFGNRVTIFVEQEGGSGGLESARTTISNLAGFTVSKDSPYGSKLARLGPFMGQAEGGNVIVIKGEWNWDWYDELTAIPINKFWDQADATSGAFNKLARTGWSRGMKK